MKKVGLVTFYNDNFGSILQCFATKITLEKLGYDCVVLYHKEKNIDDNKINFFKRLSKHLLSLRTDPQYILRWLNFKIRKGGLTKKTKEYMDDFVNEFIKPQGLTWNELCKLGQSNDYYAFIVGSDQVWNFNNENDSIYGLEFAHKDKKIALSVSLGVNKFSKKFNDKLKHNVSLFNEISVREESAKEQIKNLCGKEVTRLADPTLLLDRVGWLSIFDNKKIENNDYILVHFLNYPSNLAINRISKIANENRLRVLCIGYDYSIFDKLKWEYIDCGPIDYIKYINDASIVCTDSYHTTLFSINFEKNFYTFERQYIHGNAQTTRITEILNVFKFKEKY